jgi:hypothetical protein
MTSKKHYIALAKGFAALLDSDNFISQRYSAESTFAAMVDIACDVFSRDNPAFDRRRFTDAIYNHDEEVTKARVDRIKKGMGR